MQASEFFEIVRVTLKKFHKNLLFPSVACSSYFGYFVQFSRCGSGLSRNQSETFLVHKKVGQAEKSARGMPWHQEPKKDVTSCDKLRGGANNRRSGDFRMGKPGRAILCQRALNKIGVRGEPPELKHLSRARKRNQPRFRK